MVRSISTSDTSTLITLQSTSDQAEETYAKKGEGTCKVVSAVYTFNGRDPTVEGVGDESTR